MLKVAIGFLVFAALLVAQTGEGTIQGTVKDPSGAVIPAAAVKMVHLATAVVRDTVTNGTGFYIFPAVPIGRYRLTVQSPGMQTWEGDVELVTGQTAVVDVALKVGSNAAE